MDALENIKKENDKLRMIDNNRSDIISVTAHELRTSLSALKWILKMFANKDFGDINSEQKNYIEKAIISSERAISQVNYLLTYNNSEGISTALNLKMVDIPNMIENVISVFYGELKNKNITLTFNKSALVISDLYCDEEMITVVVQNLIENAIKYSEPDSKIKIMAKDDIENNGVLISFHNNGIGIEKEDQNKIFNKFFRASNAIKKESIGSGLGLFTSKNIIEKHNGKIWFESIKDEGTTFFILLPRN